MIKYKTKDKIIIIYDTEKPSPDGMFKVNVGELKNSDQVIELLNKIKDSKLSHYDTRILINYIQTFLWNLEN